MKTSRTKNQVHNNIFITGGAGFIGSALVDFLSKRGWFVTIYDNFCLGQNINSAHQQRSKNIRVVRGDILDLEKLTSAIKAANPNFLLHLAAIHFIPFCQTEPELTDAVNVRGTQNVVTAMQRLGSGSRKIVFASSASVYGDSPDPSHEDNQPNPSGIYGKSKLRGEAIIKKFSEIYNIIRMFNVYGPGDTNPHLVPSILEQLQIGREIRLGNPTPRRDYVYITDVACAIADVLDKGKTNQIYNVGTGASHSVKDVAENILRVSGQRKRVKLCFEEPDRMRKGETSSLCACIDKIRQDTGWQPQISLTKGLENILASKNRQLVPPFSAKPMKTSR